MGQITQTDVGKMTEEMQKLYMPDRQACGKAIPEALMLLLSKLEAYTVEVQKEAETQKLADDDNVPQWALDMKNWQLRLAKYKRVLEFIPSKNWTTPAGCTLAWRLVTAPLLAGIWYEIAPGVNFSGEDKVKMSTGEGHDEGYASGKDGWQVGDEPHPGGHSSLSPPDFVTPFMLGNQVLVYGAHQQERWQRFKDDLKAPFKAIFDALAALADLPSKAGAAAKKLIWPLVGAAAVGLLIAGGVYYYRKTKAKKRENPEPLALPPPAPPQQPAIKQPTRRQLARARMESFDY
jgi:hypothetical protein